jgi:tryptophan synthase alpha chain
MARQITGRIDSAFARLRAEGRKAFITYIMAGAPSLKRTEELVSILEENGADIIELGVPFTDPMADGPVIQQAAEVACANGVTLRKVLELVTKLRKKTEIPIVLMTYYNPVLKFGLKKFANAASKAGVDGLIIPDLPPHEADDLKEATTPKGIDTIFLFAPTSTDERRKLVARASSGFIYYVSIAGITGSKLALDKVTERSINSARKHGGGKPVALGFGVSTPKEAQAVAELADGVIVGSAIVKRATDPELGKYLRSLRRAIDKARSTKPAKGKKA